MAVIEVTCPNPACGAKLKAPADRAGKKAKCIKCQQGVRIPGPSVEAGGITDPLVPADELVPMALAVDESEPPEPPPPAPPAPTPAPKAKPAPQAKSLSAPLTAPIAPPKPAPSPAKSASGTTQAAPAKPTVAAKPTAPVPPARAEAPAAVEPLPLPDDEADAPAPLPKVKAKKVEAAAEPAQSGTDNPFAFNDANTPKKFKPQGDKGTGNEPQQKQPPTPKPKADETARQKNRSGSDDEPRTKKLRDSEEESAPPQKSKAKAVEELPPASDNAFAFGFTDELKPNAPKKSKHRDPDEDKPQAQDDKSRKKSHADDEAESDEKAQKKARSGNKDDAKPHKKSHTDDEAENKPRYQRPQGGTGKALLISAGAALVAIGLVAAVVVVYIRSNKTEEVKKEDKKEDPPPQALPETLPVTPPPTSPAPKDKMDPKPGAKEPLPKPSDKESQPKPKDKQPEPKPKEKAPAPARPAVELAGKPSFTVGKEPNKFEAADRAGAPRFIIDTPFASVVRVFPAPDPKSLDTFLLTRAGAKFSLDAYSPSSQARAGRLEFAADPKPLCDVYNSADGSRLVAAQGGRITVWDIADQKKVLDAFTPYEGKPEHAKNGLAAVFFGPNPDHIVTVSTSGAVHLINVTSKSVTTDFVPPHGAKGAVALDESVARADPRSIVLAVGGIVYQIVTEPGLTRARTYDLGNNVKPLAIAASGTPGRVVVAFEAESKGKKDKDRGLLYLPVGAAKPVTFLWPSAAGTPKGAFWAQDTEVGIITERGVVWFGQDESTFGPVVVTKPATGGVYTGAKSLFWYVVPHPSQKEQSVVVPLPIPFSDAAEFRGTNPNTPLRVARIDSNGLAK